MNTKDELHGVLEITRTENEGITIDLVARTVCQVYDEAEVSLLIERLESWNKNR